MEDLQNQIPTFTRNYDGGIVVDYHIITSTRINIPVILIHVHVRSNAVEFFLGPLIGM